MSWVVGACLFVWGDVKGREGGREGWRQEGREGGEERVKERESGDYLRGEDAVLGQLACRRAEGPAGCGG